jgi:hypothetical protein
MIIKKFAADFNNCILCSSILKQCHCAQAAVSANANDRAAVL